MAIVEQGDPGVSALLAPDRPAGAPPGAPPEGPGGGPPGGGSPRRRDRSRLVLGLAAVVVVALVAAAAALWSAAPSVGHLGDPFEEIPATARATADPAAGEAMNILVIGSDSRAESAAAEDGGTASLDWRAGGQRSDVLVVAHLSADGRTAQVVSLPRDSWVPVPGYGTTKINAAFSYGGAALAVQTVEQLTGVRIDHVAAIDFDGFARVTDALGGVRHLRAADHHRRHRHGRGRVPADGRRAGAGVRAPAQDAARRRLRPPAPPAELDALGHHRGHPAGRRRRPPEGRGRGPPAGRVGPDRRRPRRGAAGAARGLVPRPARRRRHLPPGAARGPGDR
ncbi:hypothetical protein F1641_07255 [Quadrisphaera sp. INWT6]|nr:hypothetical protein [Quadrisphaera sp. INWT6]